MGKLIIKAYWKDRLEWVLLLKKLFAKKSSKIKIQKNSFVNALIDKCLSHFFLIKPTLIELLKNQQIYSRAFHLRIAFIAWRIGNEAVMC